MSDLVQRARHTAGPAGRRLVPPLDERRIWAVRDLLRELADALEQAEQYRQQDAAIRRTHGWTRDGRELPALVAEVVERAEAAERERDEVAAQLVRALGRLKEQP